MIDRSSTSITALDTGIRPCMTTGGSSSKCVVEPELKHEELSKDAILKVVEACPNQGIIYVRNVYSHLCPSKRMIRERNLGGCVNLSLSGAPASAKEGFGKGSIHKARDI